jgi:ABC-type glycerol-3-phosphate transport system permease component
MRKISFIRQLGTQLALIVIGFFAAYAFSRLRFTGRRALMVTVLSVLILPAIATLPALFVWLNKITFGAGKDLFNLRNSLWGVGVAVWINLSTSPNRP